MMVRRDIFTFLIVVLMGLSSLSVLAPVSEASSPRASNSVSISGFSFGPSSLTIDTGDSVTWTNNDGASHTATSTSGPATFDSGAISGGGTYSFTFTTAGTYDYRCDIHTSMTASITVVAPNNPPEVSGVSISPEPAFTNEVISVSSSTSDADGDSVTLSYSWLVNGQAISETSQTLSGTSSFDKGDQIQVSVTPNDGTEDGASVISNSIIISNTLPSISSVTISPSTLNNETIAACTTSGWLDDDGDVEGYEYSWTVNGAVHQATTQTSGPFNADDVISCAATPDDGEGHGPQLSSSDVTVVAVDAPDADADGVPDTTDSCPQTPTSEAVDVHGCSASQRDDDGDGVSDADDICPQTPVGASVDNDGCAASQLDSDDDGFTDDVDAFPTDATEHQDTDGDGTGDNSDHDDDNDGWNDTTEIDCSSNSTNVYSTPLDTDDDGICDQHDDDIDNDQWNNTAEVDCNTNSTDSHSTPVDNDGDGICDFLDSDDDGDGWDDSTEIDCSSNSTDPNSTPLDSDGDGICDHLDPQDNNVPEPEPEPVDEAEPDIIEPASDGLPGFTSVIMFTAIAGAMIHLKRRRIE